MYTSASHTRIYIITVIYNRQISQIRSLPEFRALLEKHPEIWLIVADNSTEEEILEKNREAALQENRLRYIECGGNVGLSRAYNRALSTIPQEEEYWVMLSDDDTKFSMEYLENGCRQIQREMLRRDRERNNELNRSQVKNKTEESWQKREPLRILCGVVRTRSGWMSPRSERTKEFAVSALLKEPKPGIYRDLYPINSGLFLEGSAIRQVGGYDERLFLDQVDFLMMDRLRAAGIRKVGVLPGEIRQAFSGDIGSVSVQAAKKRWHIFRKDFQRYCELSGKPFCYRVYILERRRAMLRIQRLLSRLQDES